MACKEPLRLTLPGRLSGMDICMEYFAKAEVCTVVSDVTNMCPVGRLTLLTELDTS